MPRYEHILKPEKACNPPARVLCVDCDGIKLGHKSNPNVSVEQLDHWHCICLRLGNGAYKRVADISGGSPVHFWDQLCALLKTSEPTWIISYNCTRVWSLLELWECIESRMVDVVGEDPRLIQERTYDKIIQAMPGRAKDKYVSAGTLSRSAENRGGYLVLEDPPLLAKLRVAGSKGWATWMDTRNWSVHPPATDSTGHARSVWISDFFPRYCTELSRFALGGPKVTSGSQAFHGFLSGHYHAGLYVHTRQPILDLEQQSYVGGRCECYYIGEPRGLLYHLDYRSMYPHCCSYYRVPIALLRTGDCPTSCGVAEKEAVKCGIATVDLETDSPDYPYRRKGEVIYPIGRFTTTLAGPELADALRRKRIKRWRRLSLYQMEPALRSYARAAYKLRCRAEKRGDDAMASVAKSLLVCLPGRFGQRERRWEHAPEVWSDMLYGEWWGGDGNGNPCRYRSVGGVVQRDTDHGPGANAVLSIASWVTSLGRMRLLYAIRTAGRDHVYYVDTDSVLVDRVGYGRLVQYGLVRDHTLGYLSHKGLPAKCVIEGVKWYKHGERLVCAGLPRGEYVETGDGTYHWYQGSSKDQIRGGKRPAAFELLRRWDRDGEYKHGQLMKDGSVRPFEIWRYDA